VPGYPHGVYHYVLENVKGARSSIGCYHGVVSSAYTQALEKLLGGGNGTSSHSTATNTRAPATAFTLAANKSEDILLLTMLQRSGLTRYC